jgi:membrane fusion protein, multidrug efflux system
MGQEHEKSNPAETESPDNGVQKEKSQSNGQRNGGSQNGHHPVQQPSSGTTQFLFPAQEKSPDPAEPSRKPRRKWRVWLVLAVLAILAALAIYHFRSVAEANSAGAKARDEQAAGAAITVGQSKTGNIDIYVDALGTVTPIYTVTLYSQITGQVIEVHYQEGQLVNKGDPLIDIDPRPYETTLAQAEGNLEHDRGVLAEAVMDLNRYKAALDRNAIARQQYEDQQQAVVQDQGTVKADEGTVAYDQVQLSYCHIVSPISGRVGLRLVDPGNTVFAGSGSTLVVITQLQPITVVFNVSEDDLPQVDAQLRHGRTLQVDAYDRAFDKKIETGKLTSLDNEVDTTTGTIKFRATFPNQNLSLYPNQFVNARLLVKTLQKVTLVPSAAVQQNGTNSFVYIVKPGNTVAVQQVQVQATSDQETAVQGINAGVTVATSGFDRLENGVQVTVRGERSAQSGQTSNAPASGAPQSSAPASNGSSKK